MNLRTSPSRTERSTKLSYIPVKVPQGDGGVVTPGNQQGQQDLNLRHAALETAALAKLSYIPLPAEKVSPLGYKYYSTAELRYLIAVFGDEPHARRRKENPVPVLVQV